MMKTTMTAAMLSVAVALGLGVHPASAQHEHGEHGHGAHEHGEAAGHSHERAEVHGGAVTMSKEFHVETVFMPEQIRLYLYDQEQNPMHVQGAKGKPVTATGIMDFRDKSRETVTLKFVHAAPGGYVCPMHADQVSNKPGQCAKCNMKLVKQKIPKGTLWSCPVHPDENGKGPGRCADCALPYTPQDYLVVAVDLSGLKAGDARATFNLNNLPGSDEKTLKFTQKFVPAEQHGDHDEDEHGDHEHGHHDHGDPDPDH